MSRRSVETPLIQHQSIHEAMSDFENRRDTGPHFSSPEKKGEEDYRVSLEPPPEVKEPTEEEWERGCEFLDVEATGAAGQQEKHPDYPGDAQAERFLRLACENGDAYDVASMPNTYAHGVIVVIYAEWANRFFESSKQ